MKISPALSPWVTKSAAGICMQLMGASLVMMLAYAWGFNSSISKPDSISLALIIYYFMCMWIGIRYIYKLFNFPTVNYYEPNSLYLYQIIALFYFSVLGYFVSGGFNLMLSYKVDTWSALILFFMPALLGFFLGNRILLLPQTVKGVLKSLMIGLIGFVISALFIALCLLFVLHSSDALVTLPGGTLLNQIRSCIEIVTGLILFAIILYLPKVLLGSISLYFIGLPFNMIRHKSLDQPGNKQ